METDKSTRIVWDFHIPLLRAIQANREISKDAEDMNNTLINLTSLTYTEHYSLHAVDYALFKYIWNTYHNEHI